MINKYKLTWIFNTIQDFPYQEAVQLALAFDDTRNWGGIIRSGETELVKRRLIKELSFHLLYSDIVTYLMLGDLKFDILLDLGIIRYKNIVFEYGKRRTT